MSKIFSVPKVYIQLNLIIVKRIEYLLTWKVSDVKFEIRCFYCIFIFILFHIYRVS